MRKKGYNFLVRLGLSLLSLPLSDHKLKLLVFEKKVVKDKTQNISRNITVNFKRSKFVQVSKGQLISKGLFGILNSPTNRTKKFDCTTMIPQVDLFSFVFWEKLKTPKRHFEIN